jgi:hypothetical protein
MVKRRYAVDFPIYCSYSNPCDSSLTQLRVLYFVAFVDREGVRRIISLRRANRREVKHYVHKI